MALNTKREVKVADEELKATELMPAIHMLCCKYAARVTLPFGGSDELFKSTQAEALAAGLRITRFPRWFLGAEDTANGMHQMTIEAVNRMELLTEFSRANAVES